jgi:hypothetical protein
MLPVEAMVVVKLELDKVQACRFGGGGIEDEAVNWRLASALGI